jgi:hypothetical protein
MSVYYYNFAILYTQYSDTICSEFILHTLTGESDALHIKLGRPVFQLKFAV